jgi:hypothetical protein
MAVLAPLVATAGYIYCISWTMHECVSYGFWRCGDGLMPFLFISFLGVPSVVAAIFSVLAIRKKIYASERLTPVMKCVLIGLMIMTPFLVWLGFFHQRDNFDSHFGPPPVYAPYKLTLPMR